MKTFFNKGNGLLILALLFLAGGVRVSCEAALQVGRQRTADSVSDGHALRQGDLNLGVLG